MRIGTLRFIFALTMVAAFFHGSLATAHGQGGAATWIDIGDQSRWTSIASSADGTKLVAVDGSPGQIYTSVDSGTNLIAGDTNRPWSAVVCSADGSERFALDTDPVNGGDIYSSGVPLPPPALALFKNTNSVNLFWPYPSTGWVLQENPTPVLSAATWIIVTGVKTNFFVNFITLPSTNTMFFRLKEE